MKKKIVAVLLSLSLLFGLLAVTGTMVVAVDQEEQETEFSETETELVTEPGEVTFASDPEAEPDESESEDSEGETPPSSAGESTGETETETMGTEVLETDPTQEAETEPSEIEETEPPLPSESTGEEEDTEEGADLPDLYVRIKAAVSVSEVLAILETVTEEEMGELTEEQYAELVLHVEMLVTQEEQILPPTVSYTAAGPFLPPVSVAAKALTRGMMQPMGNGDPDPDALITSKTATPNADGSYTITIESYTTGEVTTTTRTVPTDIVLVLDQSGSMTDSFPGSANRQAAMKAAVNQFIGSVKEKYNSADADHRIAIVTFAGSASTRHGWTFVDDAGKTSLQNSVTDLPTPSGATNTAAGMSLVETLMGSEGYAYVGTNTDRYKVVVVFTDGVPTTGSRFDATVATNAIASSKRLKDSGVTIFSIGIFGGANPAQLYGSSGFSTNSNGTVGSRWADIAFIYGDVQKVDVPAGNRFMNYLSSNFKGATQIGIVNKDFWLIIHYLAWEITQATPVRNASTYYLTAADTGELNTIFQTIAEHIEKPSYPLSSETVIKDVVSPYFTVPTSSGDVKVYTAAATATSLTDDDWGARVESGLTPTLSGETISVTGFDFDANFVSDKVKPSGGYGNKLIIEFTTRPKSGFLGGVGVPTNADGSGIYSGVSLIEPFESPRVDIDIPKITVVGTVDKNVYLFADLGPGLLREGAAATAGTGSNAVPINLDPAVSNYGLQEWQNAFVDIGIGIYDEDNEDISTFGFIKLIKDQQYKMEVTLSSPRLSDEPTATSSGTSEFRDVRVFKPELTFQDSQVWYGDAAPVNPSSYDYDNYVGTVWKHGTTSSTDSGIVMIGDEPELTLSYTPEADKIVDGIIKSKEDIGVKAVVKIGDEELTTDYVTFQHTCTLGFDCGFAEEDGFQFLLHVNTVSLTINKSGGVAGEPYVFTIKKDGVDYTEATIVGTASVTIVELPVGTYSIVEDSDWSWRFNPGYSTAAVLSDVNPSGSLTCTNTANTLTQWLNGYSELVTNTYGNGD